MGTIQTSKHYQYLSAFLAFLLWGGWAFLINNDGESDSGVISGITQGSCSFMITLFIAHFITFQFNKLSNGVMRIVLPPIITVGITGTMLVIIHIIVGTPEILYTVAPALTVALLFAFYTVYKLHVASQQMRKSNDAES